MDVSLLGRVVRSKSRRLRDTFYHIVGFCLDGQYLLCSPKRHTVVSCPPDMFALCDDMALTPVGFVKCGCRVCIVDDNGVYEVHHIVPHRNLVYLTRFQKFNFPFPVRPVEIIKIFNPVKD